MEERRSNLMPVVVAVLLALPVLYVGSYVALVRDRRIALEPDEEELGIDLDSPYLIESTVVEAFYSPIRQVHRDLRRH